MLREALASFRRRPGYDDLTRLDHVVLSGQRFEFLATALKQSPKHIWYGLQLKKSKPSGNLLRNS
ncbi:hypothetical protein ALQ03_02892 [Pseudomonas savastanoi pv. glycinea]|uniref:Uncharacterized protein n=1 Tax=Pseudomonas savastanoi pv. glycinea TaxID=318 RepID=A0A0P9R169_PSESG|nr:hypothetical protein PsgB076_12234 [Pseudomonas savastanoi pv. glycinea str. B076]KPX38694.1 Uncharacterized protein ALO37_00783 [Pseudomonas savastanoi pv. glycinea]PYD22739.1 hypothetical protein DND36_12525 [Pseudomonas savastanoi pv. glycinea]RMM93423.1 hypothetical protein ALQ69_02553 [Pseudomonas savastanoi pv. glycinea]RMO25637.1 hypothetical protein ALQ43_02565 [Pseudomonas savastanoi pv. glycinea]